MASAQQEFVAIYLLPQSELPTAVQDEQSGSMYRHESKIRAYDIKDAARRIHEKGGVVISLKKYREPFALLNIVPKDYKRQLLQAVTFSVRGGMSAGRALQAVIESETGPYRPKLEPGLGVLAVGGSCYEAIKAMDLYDEITLAIIEAGELTGTIVDALETAVKHLESSASMQKIMFGAVSWTFMDILFAASGIVGNIYGLLPEAEKSLGNVPKEAAQRVTGAIEVAYAVNYLLLAGTTLMLAIFIYCTIGAFTKNKAWREGADKVLQTIPFFSQAVLESAVSTSCIVAQSLVRGGVSLLTVAEIASRSTRNWRVSSFWERVNKKMSMGETISRCFSGNSLFTHSEKILLVSHANRLQLAETFGVIANQRKAFAETGAKRFSSFAFFGSLLYSAIAVIVTLWVSYLQYTAMMANSNSLGG